LPLGFLAPAESPGLLGRLGGYEVSEIVGRGGTGVVLKAFDPALQRFVAVKALAAHLATNAAARRRFAREAQAAAAVVHEHVVAIHAVSETEGQPYLVMQYVAGRSLQERIDCEGPLELKEIVRIAMQAASGLAAAHAQGLVHRDVKPANILLENGVERVKLSDFGLARAIDDASLTQSGVVSGTPQYMAPEQARGEALDHRADLFSLGSVMYAMCTGHSPFRAETLMGVLRRICDDRPRPVREINPDVSEWLADVIDRLLAKQPADRFQSADELAELLGQYLAHLRQPTHSPRPALQPKFRPNRRRRTALSATAASLVALAAGAACWDAFVQKPPDDSQTEQAGPQPNEQAALEAPQASREFGLSDWNRFEHELDAARRHADALEAELKRYGDPSAPAHDPLAEARGELDSLERRWNAETPQPR
jgi:serine/threonine-protein kinase